MGANLQGNLTLRSIAERCVSKGGNTTDVTNPLDPRFLCGPSVETAASRPPQNLTRNDGSVIKTLRVGARAVADVR